MGSLATPASENNATRRSPSAPALSPTSDRQPRPKVTRDESTVKAPSQSSAAIGTSQHAIVLTVERGSRTALGVVPNAAQRLTLQLEQPLRSRPIGQQRIEAVAGARKHVELGGNPCAKQLQRMVDRFVAKRIDLRAGDQSSWQTGQSVTPGGHRGR